jgi:hypothetical protein
MPGTSRKAFPLIDDLLEPHGEIHGWETKVSWLGLEYGVVEAALLGKNLAGEKLRTCNVTPNLKAEDRRPRFGRSITNLSGVRGLTGAGHVNTGCSSR